MTNQRGGSVTVAPVQAVPDISEEEEVSLRQLVRERLELSEDPDPRRAINGMVTELPHDVLTMAAQVGLVMIAKHIVRDYRRHSSRGGGPSVSARWDSVSATVADNQEIFAHHVWTGTVWKFMADCTRADLVAAAEVKETQATGLLADVERYTRLARIVKRDQVVGDLDYAKVERIFNA